MSHTILLVDDDSNVLEALGRLLHKEPYVVRSAGSGEEAAGVLREHRVDLVICDEEMPGMPGTELLARVAQEYPDTIRIMLTGHPSLPVAMRAINEGQVYQFLTKPCSELDLVLTIRRALERKDLITSSRELLEVTIYQSGLLDKVKLMHQVCFNEKKEQPVSVAQCSGAGGVSQLLDQMAEEVRRGKAFFDELKTVWTV